MKKHNIIMGSLLAVATMLIGCAEDFLQTEPITKKTDVTYYTNPEEAETALVGIYDALQSFDQCNYLYLPTEIASDLCHGSEGSGDTPEFIMTNGFDNLYGNYPNYFEDAWKYSYIVINRANTLLQKIDQISGWTGDDQKNAVISQARFLRAFTYFNMVRFFGQCPLLTAPSTDNTLPAASPEEIYKQVFEDFKFAADNGSTAAYDGHATKYAAEALIARAWLYYTGYFNKQDAFGISKSQVIDYLKDIATGGYGLLDNPFQLWPASAQYLAITEGADYHDAYTSDPTANYHYAGELNKEVIFSIRHTATGSYETEGNDGNLFALYISPRGTKGGGSDALNMKGLQKFGYGPGWGISCPTQEFVASFESGDKRKEASVIDVKNECGAELDNGCAEGCAQYTGYYIKKYNCLGDVDPSTEKYQYLCLIDNAIGHMNLSQTLDYVIVRYADVLLMLSELTEDASYMNQVRNRAGLADISYTKEALFKERAHELCFEGVRYWDMLRYDGLAGNFQYAQDCLKGSNNGKYTVITNGIEEEIEINYTGIAKTKGVFPIPLNQIQISGGNLKQTEGYTN